MSKSIKVGLEIDAGIKGADRLQELSKTLKETGVEAEHLSKEGKELAYNFLEIGKQQGLINSFKELESESSQLSMQLKEATNVSKEHADALQEMGKAVKTSQENYGESEEKLSRFSKRLEEAKKRVKQFQDAQKHDKRRDYSESLKNAKNEVVRFSKAHKKLTIEARRSKAELRALEKGLNNEQKAASKANSAVERLNTQQGALNSALTKTKTAMASAGIAADKLSISEKQLAGDSKKAQFALDKLNEEAKELKAISDAKIQLGIDGQDKIEKELKKTVKAYELLKSKGGLTSKELTNANQLHSKKVIELEQQLKGLKPTISDVRGELAKVASVGAGFALIAREAMQFETAMADVKKTVDGTPEQMDELGASIKQMAYELGMTAEETASIAAMGGQLGVAFDDLPKFTKLAGEMSVAFGLTAEEAGNAAAKMANVWGLPLEEVRSLGDAINVLGNNTAAKEAEITDAMLRIGGNAKQFGLAAEEAAALADAMIALGKPPEVAATAINALLLKLQTAGSQGDKFQSALQNVGFSAEEMAKNIKENPQKAITDFIGSLKDMDEQARVTVLADMFGPGYADDIALLVAGSDSLAKAFDLMRDKGKAAGAMTKEFEAQMDTSEGKIKKAKSAVSSLASTLGDVLLPIISSSAESIGGVVNAIDGFASAYPVITELVTLIAGAKVASVAVAATFKLMGVSGVAAFSSITKSVALSTVAIAKGEKGISAYSRKTRTLTGDFKGLGNQMTSVNGIFASIAAWDIGTSIGDWAREESSVIRDVGDGMARVFAATESLITTGSLDKYKESFETSAETNARIVAQEERKSALLAEQKAIAQENAKLQEKQAETIRETLQTYSDLTKSFARLEESGATTGEHYKYLKEQIELLKPAVEKYNTGIEKSGKIIDNNSTKSRESLKALEEAAKRAGISMGEMTKGIKDDESDIIKNISADIDNISKSSKQSGESIERYLNGALGKVQSTEGMKALLAQMQAMPNKTKETATAIEELKTKINSATPDFVNLGNAIKSATDSSQLNDLQMALKAAFDEGKLTAEQYEAQLVNVTEQQNEINQANADAIAVENEKAYAMAATSQAQQQSTDATEQATDAIKEQAQAVKEVEESKQSLYSTEGLTNEQLQKQVQLTQELHQGTARLREARINVDFRKQLQDNAEAFREVNESISEMEGKISDGSISVSDLGKSFYDARDGAVELDEVTMERINAAVDKAKRKLAEMAQAAKDGAESLEIQLARENGDDERARKIEQTKKLADIEEKLSQAKQRGNSEEIQAYERQLELQRQIYQAKAKKEQEKQRPPEPQRQEPTQEPAPQIQKTVKQRQPQQQPQRLNVNSSEITQAVNQGIAQSDIGSLVSEVVEASAQGVINKMRDEMKRQR